MHESDQPATFHPSYFISLFLLFPPPDPSQDQVQARFMYSRRTLWRTGGAAWWWWPRESWGREEAGECLGWQAEQHVPPPPAGVAVLRVLPPGDTRSQRLFSRLVTTRELQILLKL